MSSRRPKPATTPTIPASHPLANLGALAPVLDLKPIPASNAVPATTPSLVALGATPTKTVKETAEQEFIGSMKELGYAVKMVNAADLQVEAPMEAPVEAPIASATEAPVAVEVLVEAPVEPPVVEGSAPVEAALPSHTRTYPPTHLLATTYDLLLPTSL